MMPRVGNVQVHTEGKTSESAKLMYCRILAASRSVVPLSWLLATGQRRSSGTGQSERGGDRDIHM